MTRILVCGLAYLRRLSFLLTLVASILSMGDPFRQERTSFGSFGLRRNPFVAAFAILLNYGRGPDRVVPSLKEVIAISYERKPKDLSPSLPF